jgi:hypothetical protein
MKIEELIANIDNAKREILTGIAGEAFIISNDVLSAVINRIQSRGVSASGDAFRPYSTNEVSVSYFAGRVLRADRFKQLQKKGTASYKEFRENQGLQTDYKDFTFSGQMFGQTGVSIRYSNGNAIATIQGQTPYAVNTYRSIYREQGYELLKLSKEELQLSESRFYTWMAKILNKYKL